MGNITAGWRKGAVYSPTTKVFIPFIPLDEAEYAVEIIPQEITDGQLYGGRNVNIALPFLDKSIKSQLETWMKDNTNVSIAIASNGINILTSYIRSEPIRVRETGGVNARDGLVSKLIEATLIEPIDQSHEAKNLATLESTSLGSSGSIEVTFPISGITIGASALLTGNLTLTVKDQAGSTLATDTVADSGGFAETTLLAPSGAWSYELAVDASATELTLRTDGQTAFVNY